MTIASLVLRGYSNGSFVGTIAEVVTRGYVIAPPGKGFGVSGIIDSIGQGVTGSISDIGQGVLARIDSTFGVSGVIDSSGQGVIGSIDSIGQGVKGRML